MAAQTQKPASSRAARPTKYPVATKASASPAPKGGEEPQQPSTSTSGRPDKAAHQVEVAKIQSEIDGLQAQLVAVREKLAQPFSATIGAKQASLRAELDAIRQSDNKPSRSKILEQVRSLQDGIQQKVRELQAARAKTPYRTVADVDARIDKLEKQVDSATMRIAEEKRAIKEISQLKLLRKTVEGLQSMQDAIDADRRAVDELRQQLDDPEAKAISDRCDTIKAQLDEVRKEGDEARAARNNLIEERGQLDSQISALIQEKQGCWQRFRDAENLYHNKLREANLRKAERLRAERAAEAVRKKLEIAQRLREEAAIPAFQVQIEDCQTLIDALSGKPGATTALSSTTVSAKAEVAGVPQLELRKVEDVVEGVVVRKKKEEEETYFAGKQKKGKKDKGAKAGGGSLNLSFPMLRALLSLSIPAPTGSDDVERVVEDLKVKKAWFEANQARVTAENVAKAEEEVQRLSGGSKVNTNTNTETYPSRAESPLDGVDEEFAPPESPEPVFGEPSSEASEQTQIAGEGEGEAQ